MIPKRFIRKRTWVKIKLTNNNEYVGGVASLTKEYIKLEYAQDNKNFSLRIKLELIESIGYLSCENSEPWTLKKKQ